MTPEVLAAAAATLLSALATYVPKFNTWHARLSEQQKKLLWMALLLVVTIGAVVNDCQLAETCISATWQEYATKFIAALLLAVGANQGTHQLLPKPAAVKAAKLEGMLRRGHG